MRNLFLVNRSKSAFVACALTASALLGSGISRAETYVPWHIEGTTHSTKLIYGEDGNLVYQEVEGSGYTTHLGAMSVVGLNYLSAPENGFQVLDGHGIFKAVGGDQIFVNWNGTLVEVATGVATGTYVVTGGTGRFENATGTADFSCSVAPSGIDCVADGTLRL